MHPPLHHKASPAAPFPPASRRPPSPKQITLGAAPFSNSGAAAHTHPTILLKTHGQGRCAGEAGRRLLRAHETPARIPCRARSNLPCQPSCTCRCDIAAVLLTRGSAVLPAAMAPQAGRQPVPHYLLRHGGRRLPRQRGESGFLAGCAGTVSTPRSMSCATLPPTNLPCPALPCPHVPQSYAPFTGAWRPVQKMAFLTDGGQTSEPSRAGCWGWGMLGTLLWMRSRRAVQRDHASPAARPCTPLPLQRRARAAARACGL